MKISKSNRFNYTDNTSAGFTLIELLASISIMGIVSALVGTGITFMVSSNQRLAAAQSRRVEVSQALEVISDDIRRAGNVSVTNTIPAALTGSTPPFIPVLFLNISIVCSNSQIANEQVIYSTKANAAGDGQGPNSLYRYGQIANENDSIPCSGNVPVNVPINARISDNITTTTTPTCSSPTATLVPATSAGTKGFYTCVSDTQVSIALFAALSNSSLIYGDNRTITSGSMAPSGTLVPNPTPNDCTVPDLLTTRISPSAANTRILTESLPYKGLSSTGIPITTGGSTVISQTPSAGSLIPCKTGLVTYTY